MLDYTQQDVKTEKQFFVTGLNCDSATACRQMGRTKRQYQKQDGILAFHGYQAFAPGEATPETAHAIGVKLAKELWGDRFEVVVSTHLDKNQQNLAQLKALFKDTWESIIGNCDEFLYLGGNEQSTHKYVSELLGKETIDLNTYGKSAGRNGSYSTNYQLSGRELLTPDEVRMLDNRYALLFIRGEHAVMDDKYDILKHPNLKLTVDGGGHPYRHGTTEHALDWQTVALKEDGDYELLSEEELESLSPS